MIQSPVLLAIVTSLSLDSFQLGSSGVKGQIPSKGLDATDAEVAENRLWMQGGL